MPEGGCFPRSGGSLALPAFPGTLVRRLDNVFFSFIGVAHADKAADVEHKLPVSFWRKLPSAGALAISRAAIILLG